MTTAVRTVDLQTTAFSSQATSSSSSSLIPSLFDSLQGNPYFNAGAGLAGIGLGMSLLRRFAVIGNAYFRRRFIISLQINNEDSAYPWLLAFINAQSRSQTRHLAVNTIVRQAESGRTAAQIHYLPGHGEHYFVYGYRWIKVERQREKQVIQRASNERTPFETVTLSTLGTDVRFLKRMLEDATKAAISKAETGLVIYHAVGPEWRRFGPPRRKRSFESVVLDGTSAEDLKRDLEEFIASAEWYFSRGVPYRRGYLFYGPPGTGKSSFIAALASHLGYSICMASLSERTLDDDRLNHLLNTAPPHSVIVLEDIDAAFGNREDPLNNHPAYQGMTRVTFSGLLNAIDGVGSAEERILFMTTNHVDRLDPALIRPGRVDVKHFFGNADDAMIKEMFNRFYSDGKRPHPLVEEFIQAALSLGRSLSPAQIQGHFLLHKENPQRAIERIRELRA